MSGSSPESNPNNEALEKAASSIREKLELPVLTVPIRSYSVADAVIRLANDQQCSAVMLGVSREGLLTQAVRGNIPEAIARGVDSTVILVRGTIG